jgi:DNA-binding response OmpR family regulator
VKAVQSLGPYNRSSSRNKGGLDVLIVPSERTVAESIAAWLDRLGHRVQIGADELSAGHAALLAPPDVVLLATARPDVNSSQFAELLHQPTWGKRPFVIALVDPGTDRLGLPSSAVEIDLYLVKPLDNEFLRWVLNRFLQVIMPPDDWCQNRARHDSALLWNMCEV